MRKQALLLEGKFVRLRQSRLRESHGVLRLSVQLHMSLTAAKESSTATKVKTGQYHGAVHRTAKDLDRFFGTQETETTTLLLSFFPSIIFATKQNVLARACHRAITSHDCPKGKWLRTAGQAQILVELGLISLLICTSRRNLQVFQKLGCVEFWAGE